MSFGMGLTFVPLTLTAVHHLRNEDSGIGSGVLNTMQQVGGALGPRDAEHGGDAHLHHAGDEFAKAGAAAQPGAGRQPSAEQMASLQLIAQNRSSPRARPPRSSSAPG